MAKDLPYFKFFCSEWNDGDITLMDYEAQGVFINICSYYWSKECNVSKSILLKKFRHETTTIEELINEGLIRIKKDAICINFLDEQANERKTLSKTNSANARKRWEKEKEICDRNTTASNSQSEKHAIKKREEKKREDNIKGVNPEKLSIFKAWLKYRKEIKKPIKNQSTLKTLTKRFNAEPLEKINFVVNNSIENGWTGLFWDKYEPTKQTSEQPKIKLNL